MSSPFQDFPGSPPPNPYQASNVGSTGSGRPKSKFPVFPLVMIILDLVFSGIRVLLVAAGVFALTMDLGEVDENIAATGWWEVITGAGMVVFGIFGDVAMLLRQAWGAFLGLLKILFTLGSVGVALWQLSFLLERADPNTPEYMGMMIGAGISLIFRLVLVVLYALAVVYFYRWATQNGSKTKAMGYQ